MKAQFSDGTSLANFDHELGRKGLYPPSQIIDYQKFTYEAKGGNINAIKILAKEHGATIIEE